MFEGEQIEPRRSHLRRSDNHTTSCAPAGRRARLAELHRQRDPGHYYRLQGGEDQRQRIETVTVKLRSNQRSGIHPQKRRLELAGAGRNEQLDAEDKFPARYDATAASCSCQAECSISQRRSRGHTRVPLRKLSGRNNATSCVGRRT